MEVSPWLRTDAPCSAERLLCHVYGRAKSASQFIPGWPYSFVAAPEMGRTSWTAPLDTVRLRPADDATAVTAAQLRGAIERLIAAGQWHSGDTAIWSWEPPSPVVRRSESPAGAGVCAPRRAGVSAAGLPLGLPSALGRLGQVRPRG
ncbi:transposase [Nonomuraea sp. NPDC050404]|uniref:transposase n=1 Tax=Nonomuraea sp. NPDC050404 TaxID=3155783 RepID=UPI0033D3D30F